VQFTEVISEELAQLIFGVRKQVLVRQLGNFLVEMGRRMPVGKTATGESTNIPIEIGAYMPELVDDRFELVAERQILEPGHIERDDVERLVSAGESQVLDPPSPAALHREFASAFETHRCKRGVDPVLTSFACLRESDRDLADFYMGKELNAPTDVVAEPFHKSREIETRYMLFPSFHVW